MKYVLTIAGSDSCGGAGIQADVKTVTRLGAHALVAITAVTAQNSLGITAIHRIPANFIKRQIQAIIEDVFPHAVKVGMLASGAAVKQVALIIKRSGIRNVVVDPVMKASTGRDLLEPEAIPLLKEVLFPLSTVVTPNLNEAGILIGRRVNSVEDMEDASKLISSWGPHVVVTGGHLTERCVDVLYDGKDIRRFSGRKIKTPHSHGTGCVFSSAAATFLAMEYDVRESIKLAHQFTRKAIKNGYPCGRGSGPVSP
jgi:hydroxymethylpyrimidine/phosphomethylpyrimidine kinase